VAKLGIVEVHDARQDVDHRLDVTRVESKHGSLYVEARATMPMDGSVEDDDIVTIYDQDGQLVMRSRPSIPSPGYQFAKGEVFTLTLPMGRLSSA